MRLKFPSSFDLKYPKENLRYYTGTYKQNILDILINASEGYCMYCGKNIIVDDKEEFNIEHSLEKNMNVGDNNFLTNCKYNLSIACPSCNQKYKTRMIEEIPEKFLEDNVNCLEKECNEPCDKYKQILNEYIKLNKIILQPNIIESSLNNYSIEYNLINHIFEPGWECIEQDERNFISNHIARFHLNGEWYTRAVLKVCIEIHEKISILEQTINIESLLKLIKKDRYDNILEKIFIEFLEENFSDITMLDKYCKFTLVLSYL